MVEKIASETRQEHPRDGGVYTSKIPLEDLAMKMRSVRTRWLRDAPEDKTKEFLDTKRKVADHQADRLV